MQFYIYIVQNIINNKIYVGQTKNKNERWRQHRYDCFIKQSNNRLYHSIRKHGIVNFNFTIIEENSIDIIDEAECFWIEFFRSWDDSFGYNIEKGGSTNKIVSKETRLKIGNARRGKYHTNYSKHQISIAKAGTKRSQESKLKQSISNIGSKRSDETKRIMSESHMEISIPHTPEAKQKMSEQRRGEKNIRAKLKNSDIPIILEMRKNGIPIKDIALQFKVSRNTIWKICNGTAWKQV